LTCISIPHNLTFDGMPPYEGEMSMRLVKLAALAITVLGSLQAAPASATDYIREREYYSDATYTVQVGYWMNNCQRQFRGWGQVTPYYVELSLEPCTQ
jgi:hypothetical protein